MFIIGCATTTTEPSASDLITAEPAPTDIPDETEPTAISQEPTTEADEADEADKPAAPSLDLGNTQWDLISIGDIDVSAAGITLDFSTNNEMGGQDGCNSFGGTYEIDGEQFIITAPIRSTLMMCGDMAPSDRFNAAFATITTVSLNDNQLVFESAEGKLAYQPAAHSSLQNTTWTLTGISNGEAVVQMAIDPTIFMMIDGNSVGGNAGCNSFGGDVSFDNSQLTFDALFATEMYCAEEEANQREAEFLTALPKVSSYIIIRQQLTLFNDTGDMIATFSEQQPAGLADQLWVLQQYFVGGDAAVPAPTDTLIYFEITPDNMIAGNSGCNLFNGAAEITADMINLSPLTTTRRACPNEIGQIETAVLNFLTTAQTFEQHDQNLLLFDENQLLLAQFTQAETQTLFVGPEQVDCEGVAPQKCYLVKETADADYTYFYDQINGFFWEKGYEYELKVSIHQPSEPFPADSSSLIYSLLEIVQQTPMSE